MVAIISTTASLRKILNYNEKKVQQKKAMCIHAHNFLNEQERMHFKEKYNRFQMLNELNTRSKVNMLHVSLNFDPSEKLMDEKLRGIADRYMLGIGFDTQPYLVYRHDDAGHPHIHIVSSLITEEGKRIRTQNIGRNQSEKTRKEIEKEFNLIRAESKKQQDYNLSPPNLGKIEYGKTLSVKQAMQNILQTVLKQYLVTSIPELNAILSQYNIAAEEGSKDSRIYKNGGLVYRILDDKGNKKGVPVKASNFYFKPVLKNLARQFEINEAKRKELLPGVRARIDWVLLNEPRNIEAYQEDLKNEDIILVIRQNNQGVIYGLTYIDQKTKSVCNGSDLGKSYSAKGLLEKINDSSPTIKSGIKIEKYKPGNLSEPMDKNIQTEKEVQEFGSMKFPEILNDLIKAEESKNYMPYELKKKRKRKRN